MTPLKGADNPMSGDWLGNEQRAVRGFLDHVQPGKGALVSTVLRGDLGGNVVARLVDDQVADDSHLRVDDHVRGGRRGVGALEVHRHQPRHDVVGRSQALHAWQQVVPCAVDGAQAVRQQGTAHRLGETDVHALARERVDHRRRLGDLDLLQDEVQVIEVDGEVVLRGGGGHDGPSVMVG
jgi:hypothetical protein